MGNRFQRAVNEPAEDSPRTSGDKVRGALGMDEFLLMHNAVQHHMLDASLAGKQVQSGTPIREEAFAKFFGLSYDGAFAADFYKFVAASVGGPGGSSVPFKALSSAVSTLCTGVQATRMVALFHVFSRGEAAVDQAGAERLISTLFTMYSLLGTGVGRVQPRASTGGADADAATAAEAAEFQQDLTSATTPAMLKHILASLPAAEGGGLTVDGFLAWASNHSVCVADILATHFHQLFLDTPETVDQAPRDLLRRPVLSAPTHLLQPADVLALSLVSHRMQRDWQLLFSSQADGLSFNRLNFGVGGYDGSMLFVLRAEDGQIFGAFAGAGLVESEEFQGNHLSYLFALRPKLTVLRPTPTSDGHFVFFNARGVDTVHGLGFGGEHTSADGSGGEAHRLWLNAGFDDCHVREFGGCYARGHIAKPRADTTSSVAVAAIEVWGLGGEAANQARERFRTDNAKMFDDMKSLKESTKKAFAGDAFNQQMFMSKTFQHRDTAAGGSLE